MKQKPETKAWDFIIGAPQKETFSKSCCKFSSSMFEHTQHILIYIRQKKNPLFEIVLKNCPVIKYILLNDGVMFENLTNKSTRSEVVNLQTSISERRSNPKL